MGLFPWVNIANRNWVCPPNFILHTWFRTKSKHNKLFNRQSAITCPLLIAYNRTYKRHQTRRWPIQLGTSVFQVFLFFLVLLFSLSLYHSLVPFSRSVNYSWAILIYNWIENLSLDIREQKSKHEGENVGTISSSWSNRLTLRSGRYEWLMIATKCVNWLCIGSIVPLKLAKQWKREDGAKVQINMKLNHIVFGVQYNA